MVVSTNGVLAIVSLLLRAGHHPPRHEPEHRRRETTVHKEAEVRGYKLVFGRLRSEALSPCDSAAFVERLAIDL
ncbi:MAG: Scr1 family TA system antitoxin-like transcriptional regulator [Pseudonocardiaceae bacterium]